MLHDDLPAVFVTYAADILGDTGRGLSGPQIVKLTAAYAVDYRVDLPHPTYPFSKMGIKKRMALFQNLMAFPPRPRYRVIRELCEHPTVQQENKDDIQKLKVKLYTQCGHLQEEGQASDVNTQLIEQTRHWLDNFSESLALFNAALDKHEHGVFRRNVFDDLRLSLKKLPHVILGSPKSLENQKPALGAFIKGKGGSPELANLFVRLVDYYTKYQNSYVKHDDAVLKEEVEFIFEITSSFLKHIVRLNARK